MNFTIIGDPVNLGARLEAANKAYGTRAMISERTHELAGNQVTGRELDLIRVKGKIEPTRVFELQRSVAEIANPEHFKAGLDAYRNQDWDTAEAAFNACLKSEPADPAAIVYLERVAHLRDDPPPTDWDGVWVFETK